MRTLYIVMLVIIGVVSMSAINCKDVGNNTYSSTRDDKVIQEERKVETFTGIGLTTSGNVILVQGSPQKVVVEGAASDVEKIVTEVEGRKLKLKTKPGSWRMGKVTFYITMENIDDLSISGSGSIKAEGTVNAGDLDLGISGSGDIYLADLKSANNVNTHISGSGTIKLAGRTQAKKLEVHNSGSGDIYASELQVQDANIRISGSGNCKVNVTGRLEVRVSGSGSVYYTGRPVIDASVSGSGKVKEMSM